jgi:hypothetical protein
VGLGALGSALFATLFPVAIIGGSWALARGIFKQAVRGRRKALTELMDELTERVKEEADRASRNQLEAGEGG